MFVSFEGIDGSGKSTQAALLVDRLESAGYKCVSIREPGGTTLSERVREILLDVDQAITPFSELLLFSAARSQLCDEVIKPALDRGEIVVCDRFADSTLAYQGGGRAVAEWEWLREFNQHVTGGLIPDRTFYFAVEVDEARQRLHSRSVVDESEDDRMEATGGRFFERVVEAYDRIQSEEPDRVVRLDGRRRIEDLHADIWAEVSSSLVDRAT